MNIFIVLLFGLIIGSFLNVVIYRIPNGQSIVMPYSHCPKCKNKLKYIDLIPVFSWIILKGRCRYCNEKISFRYTFVELLTGISFVIIYLNRGNELVFLPFIILTATLIADTFIDIDNLIIPNSLNIFALVSFLLLNFIMKFIPWKNAALGGITGFFLLFLLFIATKGNGIGFGDVKLISVIGLYLGFSQTILTLLLSFVLGGFFGVLLLATGIKGRKDPIPFGPWISLGAFIAMNWGENILNWYINFIILS